MPEVLPFVPLKEALPFGLAKGLFAPVAVKLKPLPVFEVEVPDGKDWEEVLPNWKPPTGAKICCGCDALFIELKGFAAGVEVPLPPAAGLGLLVSNAGYL